MRQLYQKHLLGYEERCNRRTNNQKAASPVTAARELMDLEKMVAASNGKEDIDVLGAVAALMDVTTSECAAHKRLKLDPAQVSVDLFVCH